MKTKSPVVILAVLCIVVLSSCITQKVATATVQPKPGPTLTMVEVQATPVSTIPVVASVAEYHSQSACDHPYYPLRTGASWTLSTADVVVDLAVTELTQAQPESVALMTRAYDFGDRYTQAWRCTSQGIYEIDVVYYSTSAGVVLPVTLITHTGYFLPSASLLQPGYTWDELYVIQNQGMVITSTYNYQVLSTNAVTVTGQVYPGLQVVAQEKVDARNKTGEETHQDVSILRVFALGVGIVQENDLMLRKVVIPN